MYCPSCGAEYRAGFVRCPDCDADLVAEPPGQPPEPDLTDLVEVYRIGRVDAEVIRSLLEGNGIPAVTTGGIAGGAYPVTVGAMGAVGVLVRRDDAERAVELIQAALRGDLTIGEDDRWT